MASKFSRSVHGKLFAATFVSALALYAAPASATVYTDGTVVQAFSGNSAYNFTGAGFSSPGVGDVVQGAGHPFDTDRLVVSLSHTSTTTTLDMKFYTSFNGNDVNARYADIFLGNNISTLANQNNFGYAISVGDQAANGGFNTQGFYNAAGNTETSQQIWQSRSGFIYGGQFLGTDGQYHDSPVVVSNTATAVSGFTTVTTPSASGDPNFPYLLDVTLSASNTDFNGLFSGGLSVFWGTGDCSNDAIMAVVPRRNVPEPLTLSLFSAGVIGIGAARQRKRRLLKSR